MRFSAWTPGFDPETHKSSTCQVWIKLHNLPYEFWDKRILTAIARGVGIPIRFDKKTIFGELGRFARVLVDVDLLTPLKDAVRVDTETTKMWVPVEYENVPILCDTCKSIGHNSSKCRRNLPVKNVQHKIERLDRIDSEQQKTEHSNRLLSENPPQDRGKAAQVYRRRKLTKEHNDDSHNASSSNTIKDLIVHQNPDSRHLSPPLSIRALNVSYNSPVLQELPEKERGKQHVPRWADQEYNDSDEEVIDTYLLENERGSTPNVIPNVQSDPEEWQSVERNKKKKKEKKSSSVVILSPNVKRSSRRPFRFR